MSLLCSTTLEYAGSSTSWTDGVRAFPEVPTECLESNVKIPRGHVPEACTQVSDHKFISTFLATMTENFKKCLEIKVAESLYSLPPLRVCLLCSHHLLATVYETKGEFRSALQHEKEAYSIYKSQVCFKMLEYPVCWCYVDATCS